MTYNEMMNQKEMKQNHLRKSFSDKGDLTLWQLIGSTKWCMSWSSNVRQIKGETIVKKGKRVQGFSMTC
jgi:hypothetical protein